MNVNFSMSNIQDLVAECSGDYGYFYKQANHNREFASNLRKSLSKISDIMELDECRGMIQEADNEVARLNQKGDEIARHVSRKKLLKNNLPFEF